MLPRRFRIRGHHWHSNIEEFFSNPNINRREARWLDILSQFGISKLTLLKAHFHVLGDTLSIAPYSPIGIDAVQTDLDSIALLPGLLDVYDSDHLHTILRRSPLLISLSSYTNLSCRTTYSFVYQLDLQRVSKGDFVRIPRILVRYIYIIPTIASYRSTFHPPRHSH